MQDDDLDEETLLPLDAMGELLNGMHEAVAADHGTPHDLAGAARFVSLARLLAARAKADTRMCEPTMQLCVSVAILAVTQSEQAHTILHLRTDNAKLQDHVMELERRARLLLDPDEFRARIEPWDSKPGQVWVRVECATGESGSAGGHDPWAALLCAIADVYQERERRALRWNEPGRSYPHPVTFGGPAR